MSKISELSDGGVIQGGDTLIAVRSGGNVKVTYGGSTTANIDGGTIDGTVIGGTTAAAGSFTTGSFTGDVSFGDNDKAIFGAGSDLQIYHDGSNSFISDVGTGNLGIRAENLFLQNADGSENYATATLNGAFTLSYDNSQKLATTATGIDVTGTAVTDGITSDGLVTVRVDSAGATAEALKVYNTGIGNNSQVRVYFGDNDYNTTGRGLRIDAGRDSGADGIATFYAVDQAEHSDYEAIKILTDGGVTLSHLGNNKLATTSSGIDVTGVVKAAGTVLSTSAAVVNSTSAGGFGFASNNTAFYSFGSDASTAGSYTFQNLSNDASINITAMKIDASGNVGIGNATINTFYDTAVNVYGSSNSVIQFQSSLTGTASGDGFAVGVLNGVATDAYVWNRESSNLLFGTGGGEKMRIDVSGKLLVGKSTAGFASNGVELDDSLNANGWALFATSDHSDEDGGTVALNRKSFDGNFIEFYRDTSTVVGSIGTYFGDLTIGTGNCGLIFNSGTEIIIPANITTNAVSDAAVDLGYSAGRFKDLYLSGGAYLGGTGSANKLDDYEEGTFTASLRGSIAEPATLVTTTGYYTKIGRDVTYNISFENVNTTGYSGDVSIEGLPFNNGFGRHMATVGVYSLATWTEQIVGSVDQASAVIVIRDIRSGTSWASAQHNAGGTRYLWVAGTYMTTA